MHCVRGYASQGGFRMQHIDLPHLYSGKTRDTYELPDPAHLLVVASDRLSTHNIVHASTVPNKGDVLTALTIFWCTDVFEKVGIPHHLIAYGTQIYEHLPGSRSSYPKGLHYRALVVRKLSIIPIEFIFRAYLSGSLYRQFYVRGIDDPYGLNLPCGLPCMHQFPEPVFTPTEKSADDEPVDAQTTIERYREAYELAKAGFRRTRVRANERGIEIVDGKWEIGVAKDGLHYIADEMATPDSSRFAETAAIRKGFEPAWLDKQIARDEAERLWHNGGRMPLVFPPLTIHRVVDAYAAIFFRLTGSKLADFQRERLGT